MQPRNTLPIDPRQSQAKQPRIIKADDPRAQAAKPVKWPTLERR